MSTPARVVTGLFVSALVGALALPVGAGTPNAHLITGTAELGNARSLAIQAVDRPTETHRQTPGAPFGMVSLESGADAVRITLDCLEVATPFAPMYLRVSQGYSVYASGTDETGGRYYLAINVETTTRDLVAVTRAPTRGAICGADRTAARPIASGDILVAGGGM